MSFVKPGGNAARAGVAEGMNIVEVNGSSVTSLGKSGITALLKARPPAAAAAAASGPLPPPPPPLIVVLRLLVLPG